jgi:hypothetical protein
VGSWATKPGTAHESPEHDKAVVVVVVDGMAAETVVATAGTAIEAATTGEMATWPAESEVLPHGMVTVAPMGSL